MSTKQPLATAGSRYRVHTGINVSQADLMKHNNLG